MTKIDFQNLKSKKFGNFSGQKIEKSKFPFFKLTFRRKFFREKNRLKNIFRPNFFLEKKSSKSQFKKWKFWFFDFLSGKFSKIFRSQILKINFRHEKLIFFVQIFFSSRYGCVDSISGLYACKQSLWLDWLEHRCENTT